MFQQAKNIDTAFKYTRAFSIIVIIACVCITGYALHTSARAVTESHQKIFILANGKALEAYASERKDNIPVEARDHVKNVPSIFLFTGSG